MSMYTRWARRLRAPLAAALLLGVPMAHAADIALQNVNYAGGDRQVIVKGKLAGFAGATTVTLRNLTTGTVMATVPAKAHQFGFRVKVPTGVQVPCEISVEAKNASYTVVRTAEVRNAQGICGQYTVALSGVVTDDVIPFATVTVTIGGVTYTTVADENGRYTLPITTALLDALVKIEADGTSPATGEPIEFVNLIGSFSRLLDEQLTEGDVEGNVTNVTTASYVLVLEANGGEPTSEEELRNAETSVDATELLLLAALIKLIVDDPDYSLPEGETSLLAFISNPEAVAAYLETVPQEDLDAAVASILQDSNLVAGFAAADIPSRYYAIPAAQPGYLARQGQILEFNNADGSGRLLDYNQVAGQPISEPYTWTIADGRLVVNFTNPVANDYFDTLSNTALFESLLTEAERDRIRTANGDGGQIPIRANILDYTFTRVVDGVLVDSASVEERGSIAVREFTLSDGTTFTPTLPPFVQTSRSGRSLRASIDVQAKPFAAICPGAEGATCVPGTWLANLLYSPGILAGRGLLAEAPYGDVVTFLEDGNLTGVLSGLSGASWTVDGDGALVISYASGWQQKVQIVDTLGIEFGVFSELSRGDDRYATYTINVKAADAFVLDNDYLANDAGKFWNGEINSWIPDRMRWNADGTRTLSSYFGWQFFAAGNTAVNVQRVSLQDCDGDGQQDDIRASLATSEWEQAGSGVAIPRSGGVGARLRTWYPAASTVVNGERQFYVMEDERFVSTGQLWFPPRINFLREIDAPWTCSN
jgi:hypothetical protein